MGVPSSVQIPSKAIEKGLIAYNRRTEKKNSKSLGPISLATTTEENFVTDNSTTQTSSFYYDVFGNLKSVILPTKTIEYGVDAHNRRMVKKVNGLVENYFLWGKDNQLLAVMNSSGVVTSSFVYGSKTHVPDYMIKDSVEYQIVSNHLGSLVVVIDSSTGNVAQKIIYDEFGNILSDTAHGFTPFGFAGCLYDVDTKLCRFGARDYDASIGRWLSKDPILFAGGDTNLYGYVMQDPINLIDPNGLSAKDVARIRKIFQQSVQRMNQQGLRRPGSGSLNGMLNNIQSWGGKKLGCGAQANETVDDLVNDIMNNGPMDDNWQFEIVNPNPFHQNIRATSSNPSDPVLTIDPWANSFSP